MNALVQAIAIFLICFIMMYGNYGRFATTVIRYSKKPVKRKFKGKVILTQPKVSFTESLPGYIPIWQAVVVRRTLYGYAGFTAPLAIVSLVLIVFNLFVSFVWAINSYVLFFAHIGMWLAIILHLILYAIVTADCAKMYGFGNICILLNVLLPHVACTWMVNNIPHIMSDMRKAKTFEENDGETVIKSKSDQR